MHQTLLIVGSLLLFSGALHPINSAANSVQPDGPQTTSPKGLISHAGPVTPGGFIIQIKGKVLESHSKKPLKAASVSIKCDGKTIATILTNQNGTFKLDIPRGLLSDGNVDLNIEFMDHFFIKQNLQRVSQNMLIEINGQLLLDPDPIADYILPIHQLGKPDVGTIRIILKGKDSNEEV